MSNNSGAAGKFISINNFLERFMPLLAPTGVVLGVLLPVFFIEFRPYITLIFGVITFTGALKLKVRELALAVRNPLPIIFFLLSAHVIMPVTILFLSSLFFGNDPETISGYVLVYSAPTAVSGFIWVSIFRGDPALILALILIDTILAPIVVPGTVRLLLGTEITMNMTGMAVSLIYMIVIPTIIGVALNELSKGFIPRKVSPYLGPFSKVCLVLVICANCAAISGQIDLRNPHIWLIGAVCIAFAVLSFSLGRLTGLICKRLGFTGGYGREREISMFFASGFRNTSAAMTLAIDFFPGPAALPTILGIMFQQVICAMMGKLYLGKTHAEKRPEGQSIKPAKK